MFAGKVQEGGDNDSHLDKIEDEIQAKLKEFDISISNFFSYLERNNMVDDSLVIFTSDHGMSYEGNEKPRLLDERIHVPLI